MESSATTTATSATTTAAAAGTARTTGTTVTGAGAAITRRRMRSGAVALGGMGLLAVTLVACGSGDDPDKRCASRSTLQHLNMKDCSTGGGGAYYYGGSVTKGKVKDGSFDKPSVTRGGIGSSHSKSSGG
ncbi:hypothetical protein ACIRP0_02930 [Streptomyces sp. NPDC101733]|uniref:hypothetical protein n=1 Tax=unclassified Streptomyces TaxID=2593676 RepID=UPI003816DA84